MSAIDRIRQSLEVGTRIDVAYTEPYRVIRIMESDLVALESLQERITALEEVVRPRPMDEAPEHGGEILIRDGDDHCVATWSKYLDKWGRGPCWVDASDGTPIKCPDCWWPLPLAKNGG